MKKLALLAMTVLTSFLLCASASAELEDELNIGAAQENLPESAGEVLGEWSVMDADVDSGLERLLAYAKDKLSDTVREVLRPVVGVMAVVALCACADSVVPKKSGMDYINLGGCLAIAAICVGDMNSQVVLGRDTMGELSDFSKTLLPTLAAAASASGAVTSAPVKYAATALFLDVLINAANMLVFPLICAYLTAVLADAALGDGRLAGAVKLLKWACRFIMGALVTAFTFYLSLTGVVAASTDELTTKAAKTAISAALPVVGSIVSDAAGSIVAGAGVIRGAVGVFGLIAVLAVCLIPFLKLGVRYLLLKAASALASAISGGRLSRLIDGVSGACGMILGLVGVEAVFIYISIISMIKAVTG